MRLLYIHTRDGQLSSANGRQQSQFLRYPPLIYILYHIKEGFNKSVSF